jgi:GT2 family glycosyltransferase
LQSIDEDSLLLMLTPCGDDLARELPTSPEEKNDAWEHFAIGPYVTFLISTFNRREVLLKTLAELHEIDRQCGLITETIVVDNASTDGTTAAISSEFPGVQLIRLDTNEGACAKNHGLAVAAGEFVIFLDDDSFPDVGSVRRMVELFYAEPRLGAVIFKVTLPDGSCECSAYPSVVIGCGTGFRRSALKDVGGLPTDFFMQAEEYDLSLRLLDRRWLIRRLDDLHVQHLKTAAARVPTRTTRLDVRNNLMVVTRYFPRQWIIPFAIDWTRRYAWIASSKGYQHLWAVLVGIVQGLWMSVRPGHRRPMGLAAFEEFAMVVTIRRRLDLAVRSGHIRSILLIDVGKNILPFWLASEASGLHVVAIADPRLAKSGRRYHGVPVVTDEEAAVMKFDAAVVANVSPVHARLRAQTWRNLQKRPVIDLFEQVSPLRKAA